MKTNASVAILTLLLSFTSVTAVSQELRDEAEYAAKVKSYLEGFAGSDGTNEFSYQSLRNDVSRSMLVRCTDGKVSASWQTAAVPGEAVSSGAGFVWLASTDLASGKHLYDVFIDGVLRFTVASGQGGSWDYTTDDGGRLSFTMMRPDLHGDAMGYMSLWAPPSWLTADRPLSVRLTGHAEGSNSWIIIFQAPDAQAYLQMSAQYNTSLTASFDPKAGSNILYFEGSSSLAGRKLRVTSGKKSFDLTLAEANGISRGQLSLPGRSAAESPLTVTDDKGELLHSPGIRSPGSVSRLSELASLQTVTACDGEGRCTATGIRKYRPATAASLSRLASSRLAGGQIFLMVSSHQDIAWMDSPEKCVIERDTMLITPLLRRAAADSTCRFDLESALLLKEYLHRHPESRDLIQRLLRNGQLSCGSTFIQPYEEMYSGEALARQLYFGALWLKNEFGYTANTYWNPDVPGRTLQMPQILSKAGTKYMSVSRMEAGLYRWFSPDGSSVLTYSPGHYSEAFRPLSGEFYDATEYLAGTATRWEKYFASPGAEAAVPVLSSWDMSPPVDYSELVRGWNTRWEIKDAGGKTVTLKMPELVLSLTPAFMKEAERRATDIPALHGERPDVWLYIHSPTHYEALSASREGDIMLTVAEKFATAGALARNSFTAYPSDRLHAAWEAKIFPDHGWGGKHGDITDALFLDKYLYALGEAKAMAGASLSDIASRIKTRNDAGLPVVVFNSLSWTRTDPVSVDVSFDEKGTAGVALSDAGGARIPVQLSNISRYSDGSLSKATVAFIAEEVPSVGYRTYYLIPAGENQQTKAAAAPSVYENRFYRIRLAPGGLSSIYDLASGVELIDSSLYNAGEVFTLRSVGTGAGEFSDIQQPDMEGFDRAASYKPEWIKEEDGPVRTVFMNRQPVRNAVIEERIVLYSELKKIDFLISLLNYDGVLYREYRMALPLKMENAEVSYEVPYGIVTVGRDEMEGAAGERYTTPNAEIHPRGIENWIGASDGNTGVTLSSTAGVVDYIDPSGRNPEATLIQPILISSRRSCHGEGNEYLQTGDHSFTFSLTSHNPGRLNGYRFGRQSNEKLIAVAGAQKYFDTSLPEEMSFFSFEGDSGNVVISAIKRAEDGDGVVVRFYNLGSETASVKLRSFAGIKNAFTATLTEEIISPIPTDSGGVAVSAGPYSIETVRIK